MVFTGGPLLQQHLSFAIKNKYTESTVQQRPAVGLYFLHYPHLLIQFVDQNDIFHFDCLFVDLLLIQETAESLAKPLSVTRTLFGQAMQDEIRSAQSALSTIC